MTEINGQQRSETQLLKSWLITLLPLLAGDHTGLWYPYLQFGSVAVRIYDPATHSIETVINMDKGRW